MRRPVDTEQPQDDQRVQSKQQAGLETVEMQREQRTVRQIQERGEDHRVDRRCLRRWKT